MADPLRRALQAWETKIAGFCSSEALLVGVETRTSSPVRLVRGKDRSARPLAGLYVVGEGAGHAGGIVSSILDAVECVEALGAGKGRPVYESAV